MSDHSTSPKENVPSSYLDLVGEVMPFFLDGSHSSHAPLLHQFAGARVSIEVSDWGFGAAFAVPPDAPLSEPRDMTGGHADIQLEGLVHGAGCVLFVSGGGLNGLEVSTRTEPWPEHPVVISVQRGTPLLPSRQESPRRPVDIPSLARRLASFTADETDQFNTYLADTYLIGEATGAIETVSETVAEVAETVAQLTLSESESLMECLKEQEDETQS